MEWQRQIDAYCERLDASFWAEPVNAWTNAAFIIAAVVGFAMWRRRTPVDPAAIWLTLLVVAIGIGSFLFHTVATVWAALADVLPITLFIVSFLVLTIRRFFGASWWLALGVGVVFLPAAQAFGELVERLAGDALGGSEGYLPALLALFICGEWLRRRRHPAGPALLGAGAVFLVSLTFRTLDQPLCTIFPLGTHFLWHVLNGVVLGWLVVTFVRFGRSSRLNVA